MPETKKKTKKFNQNRKLIRIQFNLPAVWSAKFSIGRRRHINGTHRTQTLGLSTLRRRRTVTFTCWSRVQCENLWASSKPQLQRTAWRPDRSRIPRNSEMRIRVNVLENRSPPNRVSVCFHGEFREKMREKSETNFSAPQMRVKITELGFFFFSLLLLSFFFLREEFSGMWAPKNRWLRWSGTV